MIYAILRKLKDAIMGNKPRTWGKIHTKQESLRLLPGEANEIFQVKTEFLQYVLYFSTCSHPFYVEADCLLLVLISFRLEHQRKEKMPKPQYIIVPLIIDDMLPLDRNFFGSKSKPYG